MLSRSDNMFLERLFEMEIPEIEDGIIEIKAVSRSAGDRSKIVVYSSDQRIDAADGRNDGQVYPDPHAGRLRWQALIVSVCYGTTICKSASRGLARNWIDPL